MFKIVTILNGRTSVPETVKLSTSSALRYAEGAAILIASGRAAACTATSKPLFISAQTYAPGESDVLIAYPITEDLILEVPVNADPTALKVGQKVTLGFENGQAATVTATTEGGVATIYDLQGAKAAGDRILVRFVG
ncbi:MAG: hypothetical protein IJW83_02620 [Clostridia bacterium]|nr:hypothetical protein [Clostridia bacterium]